MDVITVAPIMELLFVVVALTLFTLSVLSILDWYGLIRVSWINVDRKFPPQDTYHYNG